MREEIADFFRLDHLSCNHLQNSLFRQEVLPLILMEIDRVGSGVMFYDSLSYLTERVLLALGEGIAEEIERETRCEEGALEECIFGILEWMQGKIRDCMDQQEEECVRC